ncbi:MAG: hypothetical protein ACHP7J_01185 [Terriglobales bacterium]
MTKRAPIAKKDKSLEPTTKRVFPGLISELTAEERRSAEQGTKRLLQSFHTCEMYLRDYLAGGQNVYKFLGTTSWVQMAIEDLQRDLIEKHNPSQYM